ncbi:twin-arginine translocation signal domain-containing protein, partial [Adlercreutzia equolifaciens]
MAEKITGAGALSRRDFLTGSAVAAAGAAMLGLAAAEPAVAAEV